MKPVYIALAAMFLASPVLASDIKIFELTIKDHTFSPASVEIPAGEKVKLLVKNQDSTPEEFESHDLNREKVIPGNSQATIFVGPLKAGEYTFFGEFHEKTAQGKIIAK